MVSDSLRVWLRDLPQAAQQLLRVELFRSKEIEQTYADFLDDYPQTLWLTCLRQLLGGPARRELDRAMGAA